MEVMIQIVFCDYFYVIIVEQNNDINAGNGRIKCHVNIAVKRVQYLGSDSLEIIREFLIGLRMDVIDVFVFRMIEI